MKKLLIVFLTFFVCYSTANAEVFVYEVSGYISEEYKFVAGTDADGLLAVGESFTVGFTIDTEESEAIRDEYPDSGLAVYFYTHPVLAEFDSGLSLAAFPDSGNGFGPGYQQVDFLLHPTYGNSRYLVAVQSPTEFILSESVSVDSYLLSIEFTEQSEPIDLASIDLGPLPELSSFDSAKINLRFKDYDAQWVEEGSTLFVGHIESLTLVTGKKAKKEKQLICHVGNEAGPNGEVYLDDPDCVPSELNEYFCPDAGKIDLIVVPHNAKHIGNPKHSWDGMSDYLPEDVGASGEGTEDSDGNGVDDGCEPANACPCWDSSELQAVTLENQFELSCSGFIYGRYPENVYLGSEIPQAGINTRFQAVGPGWYSDYAACYTGGDGLPSNSIVLNDQELDVCVEQIADRCQAIGDPIR